MKLIFQKTNLSDAINTVQSCVSQKSTMPILSNILVQADKGEKNSTLVRFVATDLEVGVRLTVKTDVIEAGSVTLPAKKFGELVREMQEGCEIELVSKKGKRAELKCGKVKASLATLPVEDFPAIPEFPTKGSFEMDKTVLREMFRKTSFAISTDNIKPVFTGILFNVKDERIHMAATDGKQLAYISRNGMDKKTSVNAILPGRVADEIAKLISSGSQSKNNDVKDTVEIASDKNQIYFRWKSDENEIVLMSLLIDGTYPNLEQVIPKTKEIELNIKVDNILPAIKRASLFAQERGSSILLSLDKGLLKVSANSHNIGEEEEELDVDYSGKKFEVAFNPQYIIDVLKNCGEENVLFEFTSPTSPGVIRPATDKNYTYVVMPMMIQ